VYKGADARVAEWYMWIPSAPYCSWWKTP